ncbi:MAG: cytochrome c peroxidase, partial [Chitinophagaceae bacterium]
MFRKIISIAGILCSVILFSYSVQPPESADLKLSSYFKSSFALFITDLKAFDLAVNKNAPQKRIREQFVKCRHSYKKIELILEYYYDLDVAKFNGPALDFIEEEDPTAYHQPQGLQMIESLIYPSLDTSKIKALRKYSDLLLTLAGGLSANAAKAFEPEGHTLEAVMEEVYRIIALGITGFDSPVSTNSLNEAVSSLQAVDEVLAFYKDDPLLKGKSFYADQHRIIDAAILYLKKNNRFNSFNRMFFIRSFMNPLAVIIGKQRQKLLQKDNPFHYSLIEKKTQLFAESSFRKDSYLFDDTITSARIILGKKLFGDPSLSANGQRSCASCHQAGKAFTDGREKALELDGHTILARNTPTLLNAAFQHNLFFDSRQHSLDQLINEVLGNEKEMNAGSDSSVAKLRGNKVYEKLYAAAYPFDRGNMKTKLLINSISMYLRTLVSYNSRFDRHMRGRASLLTSSEINGFNLFAGKARCATCHFIPLFNGSKPSTYFYQEGEVIGVPATADTVQTTLDTDPGRFDKLPKEFLRRSFKTPTLRNIELTAPYMHNGVFPDLKSVLHFYNKGGGSGLNIAPP